MSNDWWGRKLGTTTVPAGIPLPPRQPVYVQQQQPVQPPQQYQQPAPVSSPAGERQPEASLSEVLRRTDVKGPAAKMEGHLVCPGCGSGTSYTVFSGGSGGSPGGYQARPHCFSCGYNGAFTQGDQAAWAR